MRLFIALNFDAETRARWWAAAASARAAMPSARWVREGQLHLTLAFLGEQPATLVPSIGASLDELARGHSAPFDLQVGGMGAFPALSRPRVVWLGVSASAALSRLAVEVARACQELRIPLESRDFHAHITLARVGNRVPAHEVQALERTAGAVAVPALASTRSVDLVASTTGSEGPTHRLLHEAVFGEASVLGSASATDQ